MRIDIWSDVVCPWCYLGAKRVTAALARLDADGSLPRSTVEVHWRAFELDPDAPTQPQPLRPVLERKYGAGAFDTMTARLMALGPADGIDYRFDLVQRVNTFDAHRLLAWSAGWAGRQERLADRLFRAYFSEGADISRHETLIGAALDVGLDPHGAAELLAGRNFTEEVRGDEATARALDISGVPALLIDGGLIDGGLIDGGLIDGGLIVPGAQDVDTFVRVLARAASRGV